MSIRGVMIAASVGLLAYMIYRLATDETQQQDGLMYVDDGDVSYTDTGTAYGDTTNYEAAPDGGITEGVIDVAYQAKSVFMSPADYVSDSNVQAFLRLIRTGEGTNDAGGYSRMFGGGSFASFADHPRKAITRGGLTSTAAGAYQFLSKTWDDMVRQYGFTDFSPANQDVAAVALIKRRRALADVVAGRFDAAIAKCNKEWASLPGSPYGQPTLTLAKARQVLLAYGGSFDTGAVV